MGLLEVDDEDLLSQPFTVSEIYKSEFVGSLRCRAIGYVSRGWVGFLQISIGMRTPRSLTHPRHLLRYGRQFRCSFDRAALNQIGSVSETLEAIKMGRSIAMKKLESSGDICTDRIPAFLLQTVI